MSGLESAYLHIHRRGYVHGQPKGIFLYTLFSIFLYFSDCRFEKQALYADCITLYDNSRQTISTTITVFCKYVLTSRFFNQQDWSNTFNCWVSRPGCAARSRTLFRQGEYVKSDAAPMRRLRLGTQPIMDKLYDYISTIPGNLWKNTYS